LRRAWPSNAQQHDDKDDANQHAEHNPKIHGLRIGSSHHATTESPGISFEHPREGTERVKALLAESYREEPFWWREAPPPRVPAAAFPTQADVVIVGGGYTGVMAAARLSWHGRAVALLEQRELGWGASSRNGGMVHPGFKVGTAHLLHRYGAMGRELYRASLEAFSLVERTITENQIACDYLRSGHIDLASRPRHLRELKEEAEILQKEFGMEAGVIPRIELRSEVGTSQYYGGLFVGRSGGLHPAKYHAGLVRLALDRGAQLYDQTQVLRIDGQGRHGFTVVCGRGQIQAGDVLLATNGYTDRLVPSIRRRIIPIGSYIIATEPLAPELAKSAIPNRRMLFDSQNFLHYWRISPDNRMLFGGRASFAPTSVEKARDWLYTAMIDIHPQLEGSRVEYAWGGQVGFTFDRLPHIGRIDGITYALGYCGTGVAMSTYFGQLAADLIAGAELSGCWQRSFGTVPLYRERPWFLRPAGWYYGALDRL
jgi:glycine/D-amino acid oxidase-like deaminating enzyme